MKQTFLIIIILWASLFSVSVQSVADTFVNSNINQNRTWDIAGSPYTIANDKDIQIFEGVTLTILPGVDVIFEGTATLEVGGRLIARGTA